METNEQHPYQINNQLTVCEHCQNTFLPTSSFFELDILKSWRSFASENRDQWLPLKKSKESFTESFFFAEDPDEGDKENQAVNPDEDFPQMRFEEFEMQPLSGISSQDQMEMIEVSNKPTKRESNTTLRLVMTSIRNHLKSYGFVTSQSDAQLLWQLPGTKVGIEQLLSYFEVSSKTSDFRNCLLRQRSQLRRRGFAYHLCRPGREKSFYEHFDLVFEALERGSNYIERMEILFRGRKHFRQLREVERFRERVQKK